MALEFLELVLEANWAITFNVEFLLVLLAYLAAGAHVNLLGQQLVFPRVDHWVSVDGDQDLVALAVDPYRVIEVLVLISGRELYIDVITDA